ncbi:hypothetical protein, partial [Anaerovibrio slackiae]|uniref:hypothetical protein n=1 Tax=Anaerovibrio slackiae TaxID=2652309 RepID=UPI00386BC488
QLLTTCTQQLSCHHPLIIHKKSPFVQNSVKLKPMLSIFYATQKYPAIFNNILPNLQIICTLFHFNRC